MRKIRVGDVAIAPLPGGGFGACQVSGVLPGTVTFHALDWHGPQPAGLRELRDAGPAVVTRHRVRAEVARTGPRAVAEPPHDSGIPRLRYG
jgi:hypothetical protein